MAFSALTSVGSAFAFSPASKSNAATYYAVRRPSTNGFTWQTTPPAGKSCSATQTAVVCTILTATQPTNDVVPANHIDEIDMSVYK